MSIHMKGLARVSELYRNLGSSVLYRDIESSFQVDKKKC